MFIDAKGRPCPQPVVLAIRAYEKLQEGETLQVEVDNEAAVQNLKRMAAQKGALAQEAALGNGIYTVEIIPAKGEGGSAAPVDNSQGGAAAEEEAAQICPTTSRGPVVVAVGSDEMGDGSGELGRILMKSFIYSLTQLEKLPDTVIFFNGGVRVSTEGSESIDDLKTLESQGVEILSCGTCLDFYGIREKLAVGGITNMYVIAQTMAEAGNVVRI